MSTPIAAEVFPAGEHLADELEARGWTQSEFAEILGRPTQFVSEIVSGKKEITRESASQIAAALGTTAELWLNLQDSYFLWKQAQDDRVRQSLSEVETRARLRDLAPVSLLAKRGFIAATDLEGKSREVLDLYGMQSLEDEPDIRFVARRSNGDEKVTVLQQAWVACVRKIAGALTAAKYSPNDFSELAREISGMVRDPRAFAEFQSLFAEVGVKLVYIEAFPGGKLDGCSMMLGGHPVIGISGRGKRLDIVLFTLLHEVSHVLLGHLDEGGEAIVDDLAGEGSGGEAEADLLAGQLAISEPLPSVPRRVSASWVREQADLLGVHPMTLIGRLQNADEVSWKTTLVRDAPTVAEHLEAWSAHLPA